MEFSDLKYLLFSEIFLSGIGRYPPPPLNRKYVCNFSLVEKGGTPLPPLTENHPAQKPLAERGGIPPPLNGQNPLSSF